MQWCETIFMEDLNMASGSLIGMGVTTGQPWRQLGMQWCESIFVITSLYGIWSISSAMCAMVVTSAQPWRQPIIQVFKFFFVKISHMA